MCFFGLENLKLPQNPRNSMTTQDTLKSKEFHVQRGTHRIRATFEKKHVMDGCYSFFSGWDFLGSPGWLVGNAFFLLESLFSQ